MIQRIGCLELLLALVAAVPVAAQDRASAEPQVEPPAIVLPGVPFALTVSWSDSGAPLPYTLITATGEIARRDTLLAGDGAIEAVTVESADELPLTLVAGGVQVAIRPRFLPGWVSIIPPLLAVLLSLVFREVIISLFAGVWLGAFLWTGFDPLRSILRAIDSFALSEAAEPDHVAIILFSLLIGGMVGVMGRNGGTYGIVEQLAPVATTRRRGQLAAYLQGLLIFFDDYANTLIVGPTMRPLTDRLGVSREKLAYIVDTTAAPVTSIVFISTWVGYEISLIGDGLRSAAAGVEDQAPELARQLAETSAFRVFIDTIPYRFYPILALVFVLMIILTRRDFGPMWSAERRAARGGGVSRPGAQLVADTSGSMMEPPEGIPLRWWNAAVPLVVMVATVLVGLYYSGLQALGPGEHALRDVLGSANSYQVLLWASFFGSMAAILLTVAQRLLTLQQTMDAWLAGVRSMMLGMVILVLAWSLGRVTEVLGTAEFMSSVLRGTIPVELLPVTIFAIAAAISFATGTSWGTMAILLPLVIPLAANLTATDTMGTADPYVILLGMTSSVLAGAIFGDHCSPISDTTVLSSMATACDHMDHVRTQLPYAAAVAIVGMAVGDIPTAYGLSPWVSLAVGSVALWLLLRMRGRIVDAPVVPVDPGGEPAEEPVEETIAWPLRRRES